MILCKKATINFTKDITIGANAMAIIKCKMCGGDINITGSKMTKLATSLFGKILRQKFVLRK
jgi:hypothetical protein